MALRFNPPPNWPAPPEGFNPPAGWQPDPAWGPAPEGWQLWVEDSAPGTSAGSAPQTGSAADAGWAPTQAVPTGSSAPVADPTGQSASAPSGDYAAGGSPYAANMNYAQSPTPYHNQQQVPDTAPLAAGQQVPDTAPLATGWQPIDVGQGGTPGGNKPVTKQWWFWTIIAVVVLALVIGIVVALTGGDDKDNPQADSTSATTSANNDDPTSEPTTDTSSEPTSEPTTEPTNAPTADDNGGSSSDVGTTMDNPGDPQGGVMTFHAGKYDTDPEASVEVQVGSVEWNATSTVESEAGKYSYEAPGDGNVYMRVPVTVTYHGKGQMSAYDLSVDYVKGGNTTETTSLYIDSEFKRQDMPRDGGTATGYFMFIISEEDAKAQEGVFAISCFYGDELYMQAKSF